ncbi:sigma-54 interaction domain-containing protein [Desulfurivibrio sp. C05AmB]|uniref:sigma-54 interaction domain-containing protein n=1 Tax=Desulfurivibrio sp. C05AmB TaxID=3374371 RepID=UPI00376F3A35
MAERKDLLDEAAKYSPGALQAEIRKSQREVERLRQNRNALFDIMSEMVLLIREDFVIEHLNQSAVRIFGDLRGKMCHQALDCDPRTAPCCPVQNSAGAQDCQGQLERRIGQLVVEYNYVPFQGYQGEQLVMLVMRDITQRKRQEEELIAINRDIETVLQQKIRDLKESERVRRELGREVNVLQRELARHTRYEDNMVGKSRKFCELRDLIRHVADSDTTILITGESGTGKELVADLIHRRSRRKNRPFYKFNCAAVAESLLESDLFGYEKGAFTGAAARRQGKFEIADRATIFLDEIGDISPRMQVSLLRILESGEFVRVGGNQPVRVDVRVITATNVDLAAAVQAGKFRADLYYRLNVINIHLPPLRERREDIIPLITHFVRKYRHAFQKEIDYLPNRIIDRLLAYDWPGNIRELENVIKRAVLLARENVITERELSFECLAPAACPTPEVGNRIEKRLLEQPLKTSVAEFEAKILAIALDRHPNPQSAARALGLGKTTFYDKLKRYGLSTAGR